MKLLNAMSRFMSFSKIKQQTQLIGMNETMFILGKAFPAFQHKLFSEKPTITLSPQYSMNVIYS